MADLYAQVTQTPFEDTVVYTSVSSASGTTNSGTAPDYNDHLLPYTLPNGNTINISANYDGGSDRYFGLGYATSFNDWTVTQTKAADGTVTTTSNQSITYYGIDGSVTATKVSNTTPDNGPTVYFNPPTATKTINNYDGTVYHLPITNNSYSYLSSFWIDLGPANAFSLSGDQAEIQLAENAQGAITTPAQSGSLSFSDSGASSLPTFEVASGGVIATDSHGNAVELTDDQQNTILSHLTINSASGSPNNGFFAWTFDPSGADLNFLVNQEVVSIRQTVEATDSNGHTADADLNIQLDGPKAAIAGFDTSVYPGKDAMQWLKDNTNLKEVGFYLPGAPSHGEGSWNGALKSLKDQKWIVDPIYVGRQSQLYKPKSGHKPPSYLNKSGNDPVTQGVIDADQAISKMQKQGFQSSRPIYLDVETTGPQTKRDSSLQSYIASWVGEVAADGYTPGIYSYAGTINFVKSNITGNISSWVTDTLSSAAQNAYSSIDNTSSGGVVLSEANPSQSQAGSSKAWQYAIDVPLNAGDKTITADFDTFRNSTATLSTALDAPSLERSDVGQSTNTFVFLPSNEQTLADFSVSGSDHSVLSLPSSDFMSLAAVFKNTQNTASGVTITDPTNGGSLLIAGVTKAELIANKQDFVFS